MLFGCLAVLAGIGYWWWSAPVEGVRQQAANAPENSSSPAPAAIPQTARETRYFAKNNLTLVWDTMKPDVVQKLYPTSNTSNIAPKDYTGPESCKSCHPTNYEDWSHHPHRWMNALAIEENVRGDFSGNATIEYLGGTGKFFRDNSRFLMSYERGQVSRLYEVTQTIGSRFYQYYVGKGLKGAEPPDHPFYHEDHVLPFGYWLDRHVWVPIVHVHEELPDGQRWQNAIELKPKKPNPQEDPAEVGRARGVFDPDDELPLTYARACNFCHTTFPLADMFVRMPAAMGASLTEKSFLSLSKYVASSHPDIFDGSQPPEAFPSQSLQELTGKFIRFEAPEHAATLGISCEACHLGCAVHVANKETKPSFLPQSPHLFTFQEATTRKTGRTAANINSACSRCHAGARPTFAGGISTWNSTEYTDAKKGSCYSQMTCVQCHDPHKPIGKQWSKMPDQDDQSCIQCHKQFAHSETRKQHTHHMPLSDGDRCMNCHMPHLNEGMQDVVRTHTIFSPTQKDMIESNQPNACNLCHLEKPIDWTLGHLKEWYGRTYSEERIRAGYPLRDRGVGLGWLASSHAPTRLVAASAFARQNAKWALPHLIPALDDEMMMNRQFAQTAIEKLTARKLNEAYGYWYFGMKDERAIPLQKIRDSLKSE
jgi:predicted CXXCH cytochrome family protein